MDQCSCRSIYTWGIYTIPVRPGSNDVITATFGKECGRNNTAGYFKSIHRVIHRPTHYSHVAKQLDHNIAGGSTCCIRVDYVAKCCSYHHGSEHWDDHHEYHRLPWLYQQKEGIQTSGCSRNLS